VSPVQPTIVAESQLQRALDCGELIRLYQPVFDLRTGLPVQVEALLRWDLPGHGLLAPGEFLVDEDDSTLLVRIGWSVVIEAARRAAEWRSAFPARPITVSVNLFDDHLERSDLPNRIAHLLHDNLLHEKEVTGSRALAFEVGEHHLVSRRFRTRDRLVMLHNVGVNVVVDDLGAAETASDVDPDHLRDWAVDFFATLRSFPLEAVKLHPEFVRRLETDERIRSVIDAAHEWEVAVVALAVEDAEAARRAERVGFDFGQGFHYARPGRPGDIDALLATS
jgi:EAL domain-containing protein (putative c-di-GMP-specific phosphodiesterase class I)